MLGPKSRAPGFGARRVEMTPGSEASFGGVRARGDDDTAPGLSALRGSPDAAAAPEPGALAPRCTSLASPAGGPCRVVAEACTPALRTLESSDNGMEPARAGGCMSLRICKRQEEGGQTSVEITHSSGWARESLCGAEQA